MNQKLNEENNYQKFLDLLKKEICSKEFEKRLEKVRNIDLKHYTKSINSTELQEILDGYKNEKSSKIQMKNILTVLSGNPEIVFKICLDAIKYDINITIFIEDFCLGQNTLIVEVVNEVIEKCRLKNNIV